MLDPMRPTLIRKFGNLTSLIQNTALQRDLSLTEVPVPAKHSRDQSKGRRSLEEVRASFRSLTQGNLDSTPKPLPARRVSTGAITPAFLEEKTRRDTALLASLGFPGDSADLPGDSTPPQATATDAPSQSSSSRHQLVSSSSHAVSIVTAVSTSTFDHSASSSTIPSAAPAAAAGSHTGISFAAVPILTDAEPSAASVDCAAMPSQSDQHSSTVSAQHAQGGVSTSSTSVGQDVPQSIGHRRRPSADISSLPSMPIMLDRHSTGSAAETSGIGSLPPIAEDVRSSAVQDEASVRPQASGGSAAVMESKPSFNTQIRMKWNVPKPDPALQRTRSRMAKQSSIGNSGTADGSVNAGTSGSGDTIKAIGGGVSSAQAGASGQKGPVLSKETSLKISADAIEGPKFAKSSKAKAGKGKWLKAFLCGCATKE